MTTPELSMDGTSYCSPPCDTCDTMRRLCAMCGVGPIIEGWYATDEYYCATCNPVDMVCYDQEDREHNGVTLSQCFDLIGEDNDYVYFTTWEEEDTCQCGPFLPQIIKRGC